MIEIVLVENITEYHYEYDAERSHKYIKDREMKDLKNLELNERLSYVISDVICGIKFQNIKDFLVYKYETISN